MSDQLSAESLNMAMAQMIHLVSNFSTIIGALFMGTSLISSFSKFITSDGDPSEMIRGLVSSFFIGSVVIGLPMLLDGSTQKPGDNLTSSSPFDSLPLKSIGIGLGITIIIIAACLVAWHFSKPWRDKRAIEMGHKKVMREIWRLRSRIANGAFEEQGLDTLNALAYVEDSLITFKVYKAEATLLEQMSLLKEVKPKLANTISCFGNAWKDTAIENALMNLHITSK